MSAVLASIVIPVWNRPATLGRAISSVLAQTERDLEVIVVDNGSSNHAPVAALVAAAADDRVRLWKLDANRGPSGGRNAGAGIARGRLIGFLDSDDEFEPRWLEAMTAPFADPDCAVVTCGFRVVHPDGSLGDVALPERLTRAFHYVTARFQAGTMLIDAAVLRAVNGYDERLWFAENTDLGLRLAKHVDGTGRRIAAVHEPLLRWHKEGSDRTYGRKRLEAAELLLAEHADEFAEDRHVLSSHLAVAGVTAARLGELARARRHFWKLVLAQFNARNLGRFAVACVPPVAKRVWSEP
jgi:glycosyltransferase involved in cell wall biosynthesis